MKEAVSAMIILANPATYFILSHNIIFEASAPHFQENHLDQIEVYCLKIEQLNDSYPHVARTIEKCALEAVTILCQVVLELLYHIHLNCQVLADI